MIASLSVPLAPGDMAAPATTAAAKQEAGSEFGAAVKSVAQEHGHSHHGKKAAADGDRSIERNQTKDATSADRADEDSEDVAADTDEASSATDDLLGRLLATGFQAVAKTENLAPPPAAPADAGNGDGDGDDAALPDERIIISTVADLNGATSAPDTKSGRIALRVIGMETHFEPRLDAPVLVEPAEAAALDAPKGTETAKAADASSDAPVKPAFEEVLQRLGRGGEGEAESPPNRDGQHPGANDGKKTSATATREARVEAAAASAAEAASAADDAGATKPLTTGQIISSQVAERIIDAFAGDAAPAAATSSSASTSATGQVLRMTAGGAALKTLSIQLEPQDLGRVDVSMRLVDGRLTVELVASEASTAQALAGDRHGLRKILEHAGFALDDAAITVVARDLTQVASSASAAASSGDRQNAQTGSGPNGGTGERRAGSGESSQDNRQGRPRSDSEGEARPSRPRSPASSVYL